MSVWLVVTVLVEAGRSRYVTSLRRLEKDIFAQSSSMLDVGLQTRMARSVAPKVATGNSDNVKAEKLVDSDSDLCMGQWSILEVFVRVNGAGRENDQHAHRSLEIFLSPPANRKWGN